VDLHLTELQQITLRDILVTAGLTTRQVEDIFLLLSFKRERVQLAFYYRSQGMTYAEVADMLGEPWTTVYEWIMRDCENIAIYFRESPMKS
jgi:DNA-directed RNA polymerase specialized sigma24 family protein